MITVLPLTQSTTMLGDLKVDTTKVEKVDVKEER